jgi:DNA-binding IclR family transcriptional regulator
MGKALLAFAPDVEVRRVVTRRLPAYTARTLNRRDCMRNLQQFNRAGGGGAT